MEYQKLIIKFLSDEISDAEMILLKSWLEKDPGNRRIFDEENELWQGSNRHIELKHFNTHKAWINISSRLGIGRDKYKSVIINKNDFRILIAVALVIYLLAIGGLSLWISGKRSFQQKVIASTIIFTNEGEKAHVLLADSTEIFMNSKSTLQYSEDYNINDRIVKLEGEAFFDVHTNPEKPFVVQLDQMNISATGTQFNVLSFSNENRREITLEKGEIQVLIKNKDTINLKSSQQVVYLTSTNNVLVRDVVPDTYTSWKENKLRFDDTPFEEVLNKIARKYNVTFEITNRDLLSLKFTATFIDESIEEVMQMLSTVSPITYKIYYRTSVSDKQYLKPNIVVGKRKSNI